MSRWMKAKWITLGVLALALTWAAGGRATADAPPSFPSLPPGPTPSDGPGMPPVPAPPGVPGLPGGPAPVPSAPLAGTWASRMIAEGRVVTLYLTLGPSGDFRLAVVDAAGRMVLQIGGQYMCANGVLALYANGGLFGSYQVTSLTFNRLILNGREYWARIGPEPLPSRPPG